MAEIARVTINWSGFQGAPGFTNLHFRDFTGGGVTQTTVDNAVARTDTWVTAWLQLLPGVVFLGINPTVEIVEETTNQLQSFMTATPLASRKGAGTGAYSGASGACINWTTNGVRKGRRVRGRTFMVPINGNYYDSDGTIAAGGLTAMRAANQALITTTDEGDLGVYSRPSTPGATDGIWHLVSGTNTPDKVAILRSRRD